MYSEELVNRLNQKIDELATEIALFKTEPLKLANKIDPSVFANNLLKLHWHEYPSKRANVLILQAESGKYFYQANIPTSRHLSDYDLAMYQAAKELARFRSVGVKQVLVELVLATNANQKSKEGKIE